MGTRTRKSDLGNKVPVVICMSQGTRTRKSDKNGNKVGIRTPKWEECEQEHKSVTRTATGTKWEQEPAGTRIGRKWEGNKVGIRTQKWDKNENKVGTRTWGQSGNKNGNKVRTETPKRTRRGTRSGNKAGTRTQE